MSSFHCRVCGEPFDVSRKALEKFPGWQPKYCRAHSPNARAGARPSAPPREENLTRAEVLARYTGGPNSGVFTDGSAHPNPGPGGFGVVWVEKGEIRAERHGHEEHTTNNRMELVALIEGYKLLPADARTVVRTDSRLCVNTILDWAPTWEKRGWQKKGGPIKNLELVQELLALHRAHPACKLEWIAAHSGHRWNEYADSLSTAWMRSEV
jgi:ribonuclease HI